MTIYKLCDLEDADALEKLTTAEVEAFYAPYLKVIRPEKPAKEVKEEEVKVKAKRVSAKKTDKIKAQAANLGDAQRELLEKMGFGNLLSGK